MSKVEVAFDAPQLSSDGGVILLRQMDDDLGLTCAWSDLVPDDRDSARVVHSRQEQLRQRIYQIALGYEDCNDADRLRHDPGLRLACDQAPRSRVRLSSQPTLSRLDNVADEATIEALTNHLEQSWVDGLADDTSVVILDVDSTHDPVHGRQQLAFFHGFYDEYIYHPLLVFDGQSGQLITALLRAGNTHASRDSDEVLSRLVVRIKKRFPDAQILLRADSGFCVPALLELFERLSSELGDVDYLLGIARNARLERELAGAMAQAKERYEASHQAVQQYVGFRYAAGSWPHERWVIGKAEYHAWGTNPRFVITSLTEFPPRLLYRAYCQRGAAENCIKDFKSGVHADRLSCHRFIANAFRLLLHAAAYRLLFELRQKVAEVDENLGRHEFKTLRLKLLKVAALVRQSVRRILVRMPRAFPHARAFTSLMQAVAVPSLG